MRLHNHFFLSCSIFCLLFFVLSEAQAKEAPSTVQKESKIVLKNNAGYPIPHLSITRINEEPTVDILDKPMQHGEVLDIFVVDPKTSLLLWLIDEDYNRLAIDIGNSFQNLEYIEIQNNGGLKFVTKDANAGVLTKN